MFDNIVLNSVDPGRRYCFLLRLNDRLLCALPGGPSEMKAMFASGLEQELAGATRAGFARCALKIAGPALGEGALRHEVPRGFCRTMAPRTRPETS